MIHNSIKKIGLGLGITLLLPLGGCTDLDEKWYSEVVPDTYFTSKESIYGVLGRPFTHWKWFHESDRFYLQEFTTDEMCLPTRGSDWYNGGQPQRMHYHTWTPDDSYIWNTWRGATMGMAFAMEVIDDLEKVDYEKLGLTQEIKESHLMQMNTLNAYFYMKALDFFGGVPIYYSNGEAIKPRSTDVETFEHIEKLLTEAIPKLEKKTELGKSEDAYIRQATAASLLAQLYFNAESYIGKSMYEEAAKLCEEIISGKYGSYELDKTWWGPHGFDNDQSPEIIWTIPSENAKQTYSWWFANFYHYEAYKSLNIETKGNNGACLQPSLKPTGELYTEFRLGKPFSKFHEQDLRKQPYVYHGKKKYDGMFLFGEQINPYTGAKCMGAREYKNQVINLVDIIAPLSKVGKEYASLADVPSKVSLAEENSGVRWAKSPQPNMEDLQLRYNPDCPVIRLSEIYYMLAECKMRLGDKETAATLINQVRKRNFEGGIDPNPVTAANLDAYRMLDEWMVEFIGEGMGRRRTDLIRWNMFVTEKWWDHEPTNDPTRNRFPVPTQAFSANNLLEQNPGY